MRGYIPGPGVLPQSLSPSGAVYISDFENRLIQNGCIFGFSKRFTIAGGGTAYFLVDPTAFTGNYVLMLPPIIKSWAAGPVYIDVYKNPTYTGGTTVDTINFNQNSSNTSEVVIKLNPSVTDNGTKLPPEYVTFSSTSGVGAQITQAGGEAAAGNLIFDLKITDKWLYVLTNQDATNAAEGVMVTDWAQLCD